MAKVVIIIRILMGLLFLMASTVYFLDLFPKPELTGSVKLFNEGIEAAVYLIPVVKTFELLCGIAFVTGRFVPLATVVIFPIIINIFLFHFFLSPEGLPIAIFLLIGNLFLAYTYRRHYELLMAVK
ncbi:DoxX family protein [bacterium]|nr:DoxX family protein [bacterium]